MTQYYDRDLQNIDREASVKESLKLRCSTPHEVKRTENRRPLQKVSWSRKFRVPSDFHESNCVQHSWHSGLNGAAVLRNTRRHMRRPAASAERYNRVQDPSWRQQYRRGLGGYTARSGVNLYNRLPYDCLTCRKRQLKGRCNGWVFA